MDSPSNVLPNVFFSQRIENLHGLKYLNWPDTFFQSLMGHVTTRQSKHKTQTFWYHWKNNLILINFEQET